MRNITISLNDDAARAARVRAAERDMSVSRYFAELLQRDLDSPEGYDDAMKSYLSGLSRDFFDSDPSIPYPTKDEIHDRTGLR